MPHDLLLFSRLAVMLVATAALAVYRREIQQALERFNRRGPGPPTGPLPANDSFLLLKKQTGPVRAAPASRSGRIGLPVTARYATRPNL